jgi:hypothetical protein
MTQALEDEWFLDDLWAGDQDPRAACSTGGGPVGLSALALLVLLAVFIVALLAAIARQRRGHGCDRRPRRHTRTPERSCYASAICAHRLDPVPPSRTLAGNQVKALQRELNALG